MWKSRVLVRHAFLSVVSEPVRSIVIMVLLVVVFGGITYSDLDLTHQIRWEEQQRVKDGINIVIASGDRAIDAGICEQIGAQAGFLHSGSLTDTGTDILATDRATLIPSGVMSVGFLDLLDQSLPALAQAPGVLIGEELANHLDFAAGATIELMDDSPQVVGVIKESGRSASVAGWMIKVEPAAGMADHCWVETEPGLRQTGETIMRSLFTSETPIDFTTLTNLDVNATDLTNQYHTRIATVLQWPIIIAIALIAGLTIYARRSEYGLDRALNMRFWHVLFITEIEWLTYALPSFILGVSLSVIVTFFRWSGVSDVPLLWGIDTALADTIPLVAATIVVPSLIAGLWRTNPAQALKDR